MAMFYIGFKNGLVDHIKTLKSEQQYNYTYLQAYATYNLFYTWNVFLKTPIFLDPKLKIPLLKTKLKYGPHVTGS